jgi:hypothetical protein
VHSPPDIVIKFDSNIFNSDVIALTETQLLPHSTDVEIRNHLHPFTLYRQDHASDIFSSLAVCTNNNAEAKEHEYFPAINAIKFVLVNNTTQLTYTVLLLYRKNSSNILQYVDGIRNILNDHDIDMILGDFNINFFNEDEIKPLKTLMDSLNYTQVVHSSTFVSAGTLLDHIYVKEPTNRFTIHCSVVHVYYSDHDAVKISIIIYNLSTP